MLTDWTNFAKSGIPNKSWPKFSSDNPIAKIYGDRVYEDKLKDYVALNPWQITSINFKGFFINSA